MDSADTARQAAREAAQHHLADLLAKMRPRSGEPGVAQAIENGERLQRAISAFHMEAIRFHVFTIDRFIRNDPQADADLALLLADLRASLEAAGFQTSSKGL